MSRRHFPLPNFDEFIADWKVRLVGAALALAHALTAWFWYHQGFFKSFRSDAWASCYPFFPGCQNHLNMSASTGNVVLLAYAVLSLACALLLSSQRASRARVVTALFGLAVVSIFKITIYFSRFDLMGNYHLMHFVLLAAYFVLPNKLRSMTWVIATLYFAAGVLKLNLEWLSGAALLRRPVVQGELLLFLLAGVVVLETVMIWGLLARDLWIRRITALLLVIFHAFSWHIVGYFYPLTMALLLTPVWLSLASTTEVTAMSALKSKRTATFLVVLLAMNLLPKLGVDPALDGSKRIVSLSMLDARTECRRMAMIRDDSRNESIFVSLPAIDLGLRVNCDHLLLEGELRKYCPELTNSQTLSYSLFSRRTTDAKFTPIRSVMDFCHAR